MKLVSIRLTPSPAACSISRRVQSEEPSSPMMALQEKPACWSSSRKAKKAGNVEAQLRARPRKRIVGAGIGLMKQFSGLGTGNDANPLVPPHGLCRVTSTKASSPLKIIAEENPKKS